MDEGESRERRYHNVPPCVFDEADKMCFPAIKSCDAVITEKMNITSFSLSQENWSSWLFVLFFGRDPIDFHHRDSSSFSQNEIEKTALEEVAMRWGEMSLVYSWFTVTFLLPHLAADNTRRDSKTWKQGDQRVKGIISYQINDHDEGEKLESSLSQPTLFHIYFSRNDAQNIEETLKTCVCSEQRHETWNF